MTNINNLNVEPPAYSAYPPRPHKQVYVPQAYPGDTNEQPQVVLFDSQRPQLQGGGVCGCCCGCLLGLLTCSICC
ncbi:hypothetical protein GGH19_000861 [Coemansia sp. RSA 1807]|nr:hypothetical protein GGH20_003236 [Coemansia sp. RSA 1937]KAJ2552986.1 hypothetical protein IWW35_002059 [Coemansia sp. RSA 1878]KAJ2577943.1 hypothetical protein GGH19_000861 [Coemansia sp. RSA 1807]